MRYRYHTVDVFTTSRFGGNQLAVIPDASGLTPEQMQQIAREFNYSETVFILPPRDVACLCRLRIFTPDEELPFAGHPTIGAAFILHKIGMVDAVAGQTRILLDEDAGPVPVEIEAHPELAGFRATLTTPRLPEHRSSPITNAELARLLGLSPEDLLANQYNPEAVSCGLPFLFIPLRSRAAVGRLTIDHEAWRASLAHTWAPLLSIFSFETESPQADLHVRVLCPGLGITEDPATGSAAAALGGYLAARHPIANGTLRWTIEQGIEMGRPSLIEVAVDKIDGAVGAVRVAGSAVPVMDGEIEV
jgi:trans-2,3-dihydro-3-hydroxyanthranilate isomerase